MAFLILNPNITNHKFSQIKKKFSLIFIKYTNKKIHFTLSKNTTIHENII